MKRLTARVYGAVQGVGYRAFALSEARRLGLSGYVRNCADGSVEVVAEGEEEKLQSFLERLQRGPSASHVDYVDSVYSKAKGEFESFTIRY
ncbi:MAG: acylphosphatase [Fimbriimonadales bacterium]|nr:acylphosphatase [Fimbriimonadales bacterium]